MPRPMESFLPYAGRFKQPEEGHLAIDCSGSENSKIARFGLRNFGFFGEFL
jgi:hypothetical protein